MPSSVRYKPVQQRSRATIDKILSAATRLLVQDGYAGLSTNRIAEDAGVGIGTVYRYFSDKNELLTELRDRASAEITKELIKTIGTAVSVEPEIGVPRVFVALVDALERNKAIVNALAHEVPMGMQSNLLPEVEAQMAQFGRIFIAVHRPDLTDEEVDEYVYIGMALAVSAALRIAVDREPHMNRQRLVDSAAELITAWLVPKPSGDKSADARPTVE